jgi:tripartite ATP-independent transporter DctM subunit
MVGAFLLFNGEAGLRTLATSISSSIRMFSLLPIIFFVLMGSILFESGIATNLISAVNKLLGRLPGRLGLLAVLSGTLMATLSGSSMGSTAMLGSVLVPEMEKHGYHKSMIIGPILGSGSLAIMIPPTSLGVLLAVIAQVSVGKLLIAIIIPGLVLAVVYAMYVILRAWLQPAVAPSYSVAHYSWAEKSSDLVKYVVPLAFIVFLVTGIIFLGIATPSESAAVGCFGSLILAAAYGKFSWKLVSKSLDGTVRTAVMVLIIMASAIAFSQVLGVSGATQGMSQFMLSLPLAPIVLIIGMQIVIVIMGCFMDPTGIILIAIPLFMPVIRGFGLDPIWFTAVTLMNIELAVISPPFGLTLFVMKGVAGPTTKLEDVYKAALPFCGLIIFVMALQLAFPSLALWLTTMMK